MDDYDYILHEDSYDNQGTNVFYMANGNTFIEHTDSRYQKDYRHFAEDLDAFDGAIIKANHMYNIFETELNKIFGVGKKGYGSLSSSGRDKAELGKAVDGLGKTITDLIKSKAQLKKQSIELDLKIQDSIMNMKLKEKKLLEDGTESNGDMVSQFTDLIKEINKSNDNISIADKKGRRERLAGIVSEEENDIVVDELALLDATIQNDIVAGDIAFTQNDKAMKYDAMGIVEYQYDTVQKLVIPVNKTTNTVITDYPESRIPKGYLDVIKVKSDVGIVDTLAGSIPIYSKEVPKEK